MALALSAAPLLGVELSAEDVLLERLAPPKLVHNVAVCSRWSPRYEALHVLPWLAHHNLLGVDHFFMYLAPPYTNASSPLELRVRALVAASPMVTLLQTDRVPTILGSASEGTRSLDTEGVSLVDCMQRLRRSIGGIPCPVRAQRTGKLAALLIASKDIYRRIRIQVASQWQDQMRRATEAGQSQPLAVLNPRQTQRAVANGACAQHRRRLNIL